MVESAAHLVDHAFPEVPIRLWVLTFPFPLRFLLAAEPRALTEVLAVVQRGISTFLIRHAGFTVSSGARTGAVTLIQRFGSALNLNIHLHGAQSALLSLREALRTCSRRQPGTGSGPPAKAVIISRSYPTLRPVINWYATAMIASTSRI